VEQRRSWRLRLGLSIVSGVAFAIIGDVLSLTQGSHAQRWPWLVVGGVLGVGLVLICYDGVANRFKRPVAASPGSVVFHDDGRVVMMPGAETLGASVGAVGPDQKVFYAEAITSPKIDLDVIGLRELLRQGKGLNTTYTIAPWMKGDLRARAIQNWRILVVTALAPRPDLVQQFKTAAEPPGAKDPDLDVLRVQIGILQEIVDDLSYWPPGSSPGQT